MTSMSTMTPLVHDPDKQPEKRKGKAYVKLCASDIMMAEMQILTEGGENNMHSHPATDGLWWVNSWSGAGSTTSTTKRPRSAAEEGILVP